MTSPAAGKATDKPAGRKAAGNGKRGKKAARAKTSAVGKRTADAAGSAGSTAKARRAGTRPSDVSDAVYVAESDLHGLGMFAARSIPAGTLIGRLIGMPTHDDGTYVLWVTDELGLELIDDLRFINHDADPNCALSDIDVTTLRDIAEDEELTHDYGWR